MASWKCAANVELGNASSRNPTLRPLLNTTACLGLIVQLQTPDAGCTMGMMPMHHSLGVVVVCASFCAG